MLHKDLAKDDGEGECPRLGTTPKLVKYYCISVINVTFTLPMFPAATVHSSPVCPKRSELWDFGNFFLLFQVLLRQVTKVISWSITVSVIGRWGKGAADSWKLKGALWFTLWSTMDAIHSVPACRDGVPHVQIKV